ncbi:MAG: MerR family transcriptional regulator [Bdellovibrionaceae bacterium]|nr:MerR family transcriptional regulator [Bdellovibrionales bacterium]MCB9085678.1 MerR family transcriptional regulator [Pseudobdellovibrionaceae bacterium]
MKLDINHVSQITGLTVHIIRAWEKRYGVVSPERQGKNRAFTYEDVERLKALKALVELGYPIRKAAKMSAAEIEVLLPETYGPLIQHRQELLQLLSDYQLDRLLEELHRHRVRRGVEEFLIDLVVPLMAEVGRMVATGELSVSQEHAVSALVRDQIIKTRSAETQVDKPLIAFCTPEGDYHELGILIASKLAQSKGYPTLNFGANLPIEALVDIIKGVKPKILVLSAAPIESNFDGLPDYLSQLRSETKKGLDVWVSGALARQFAEDFRSVATMKEFFQLLD